MEINLFQDDEPQKFEQVLLFPYPDLKRIWVRAWIVAKLDQNPNVEIRVMNPDGSENNSIYLIAHAENKINSTLHLRKPEPGVTYRVLAELSLGMGETVEVLDHREFDMVLEFRDPEEGQRGFGFGFAQDHDEQSATASIDPAVASSTPNA